MATHTLVYFSGGSSLLLRESLKEVTSQFTEGTTAAMLTYMGGGKGDLEVAVFRQHHAHVSGRLGWTASVCTAGVAELVEAGAGSSGRARR